MNHEQSTDDIVNTVMDDFTQQQEAEADAAKREEAEAEAAFEETFEEETEAPEEPVPPARPLKVRIKEILGNQALMRAVSLVLCVMIFAVSTLITYKYILFSSRGFFHSDCTDTLYWAYASHVGGRILNPDFQYACLLPFGTSLIMQPLIAAWGLTMKAQVVGMAIFYAIYLLAFGGLCQLTGKDWRFTAIACTLLNGILLSSEKIREIFFGHTIYYTLGLLFLMIAAFLYIRTQQLGRRVLTRSAERKKSDVVRLILAAVLLVLLVLLAATDGLSALSIFLLPFLAAILAEYITAPGKLTLRKGVIVAAEMILGVVLVIIGTKLQHFWARMPNGEVLTGGYEMAYSNYANMNDWTANAQKFVVEWLRLFGVVNMEGQRLATLDSVKNLMHIFSALLLLVFPIVTTCFYSKFKKDDEGLLLRLWVWIHWAVTTIVMVGYICGLLSAANWRLLPIGGSCIMLMCLFVRWSLKREQPMRIPALLTVPIMLMCVFNFIDIMKMPADNRKDNQLYEIVDILEDNGLNYGYATFWRANAMTVISDDQVKTRCVDVNDNGVGRSYYQTINTWYGEQEGQDKYFLLLDNGEYGSVQEHTDLIMTSSYEIPVTLSSGAEFHVLVFDHAIV